MRQLRAWWFRVVGLFGAGRLTQRFDAELESHIELHVEENISRGMTPEEARRQALIALGGVQAAREAYRDRGGIPVFDTLAQDVRFALRMLRKAPGFTAAAVIVLALGIGANGAVFSLINALLIRPLNGGTLDAELVGVYSGDRTRPDAGRPFSYPEYVDLRDRSDVFSGLIAEAGVRAGITEAGRTRRISAMLVSSNYFSTLKVPMVAGRAFTRDEENPLGGAAVAVASHAFWRQHGFEADLIGRHIVINGQNLTVVGIAPKWFHGTMPVMSSDLWLPFGASALVSSGGDLGPSNRITVDRSMYTLLLAGTLKPGVTVKDAEARLAPLADALAAAFPESNKDQRLVVQSRSRTGRGPQPRSHAEAAVGATVLMAIAGMVLFVACLNLANMLLARGGARRQEIAIRLAIGGGRLRIVQQLLVEGLLLALMGGAAALTVSWLAADRFVASLGSIAGTTINLDVSPDARVVAIVILASILSAVVFSLGPAWRLSKPNLAAAMKACAPLGAARRRRLPLPSVLVSTQVALSLALLVAAGVFTRAGVHAASSEPGFALRGGLVAEMDTRLIGFSPAEGRAAYAAVLDRVRALPEVRDASLASIVPFGNSRDGRLVRRDGGPAGNTPLLATFTVIGDRYFGSIGLPLIAGREFTAAEAQDAAAAPVTIVDRLLAERLFGADIPIGRMVRMTNFDGSLAESLQIVGVVPTVRDDILEPPGAHLYVPFGRNYRGEVTLHARVAAGTETVMLERVREAIHGVDERLPIVTLRTLTDHRDASPSLWAVIFAARLFAAFGIIALVLATVGVYGLRAYLVTQRTREIGIRMALGATRRGVVELLLREGARMTAAGVIAGLALALGLVQILRQSGMLFDVSAVDPIVFTLAPLVLAIAATLASYVPARRALQIDPAVALRPD
jgi:predicted permease